MPFDLSRYMADRVDTSDEQSCWPWRLSLGSHGYGNAWDGRTVTVAHRLAWILANGAIPDGLTVDHVCHNRRCCNPSHLRLLSNVENATDQGQRQKMYCPAGHEYAGANLYVDPEGHRRCRQCARDRRAKRG